MKDHIMSKCLTIDNCSYFSTQPGPILIYGQKKIAQALGISLRTLTYFMKKYPDFPVKTISDDKSSPCVSTYQELLTWANAFVSKPL